MRLLSLLVVVAQVLLAVPAFADAYEDGLAAYLARNYANAVKFWEPVAEAGNAGAQNSMGVLYQNGQGVPKDEAMAAKWFLRAALNGNSDAQLNLGSMYENGRGVARDLVRAHKWYDIASAVGGMRPNPIEAITARNRVAAKMNADDITLAKTLAQKCRDSKFWECD